MIKDDCKRCRLHLGRKTIVKGYGPLNCRIMFVGEAPGRDEDNLGSPFVGSVGRVLTSLCISAGLNRKDCYITNIVKCRPPNNRDPELDEIDICTEYLKEEIKIVRPKIIVCLGDISSLALTGFYTRSHRGTIVRAKDVFNNILCIPTHHPSRLFYDRKLYTIVVWDIIKAMKYEEFEDVPQQYAINPSLHYVKEFFEEVKSSGEWCAVDIETTGDKDLDDAGLDPRRDIIVGIGFSAKEGKALHLSSKNYTSALPYIKSFLEGYDKLVFQNGKFDRRFLKEKGIDVKMPIWDTLDSMYILNPDLPKSLDFLRSLHTNLPPYKHIYWGGGKNPITSGGDILGKYNCLDADCTYRIAIRQHKESDEREKGLMKRLLKEDEVAIDMMRRGILLDQDVLVLETSRCQPKIDEISTYFWDKYMVEVGSPKQLSRLLFEEMSLPYPAKAVKKTLISVDENVINYIKENLVGEFVEERKALDLILEHRMLSKIVNTYCMGLMNAVKDDGRIHAWWNPCGTDTGRWSSSEPALQNIPPLIKKAFVPAKDKVYLYSDYDRVEIWVAAILSDEEEVLTMLKNDIDIHNIVRTAIAEVYPRITRTQAKTILFGTFYGRSPQHIAYIYQVPVEAAKEWQDIFFNRFPKFRAFFRDKIPKNFEEKGYSESFFGRRKYAERLPQAMNHPIQSVASDIQNNALYALYQAGFHNIINQHDAIICEEDDESRLKEMKEIMSTSSPEFYPFLPCDGNAGYSWYEVAADEVKDNIKKMRGEGVAEKEIQTALGLSDLVYKYY